MLKKMRTAKEKKVSNKMFFPLSKKCDIVLTPLVFITGRVMLLFAMLIRPVGTHFFNVSVTFIPNCCFRRGTIRI